MSRASGRARDAAPADVDSLASPTLALLYLAQGHDARARALVARLLARDPSSAVALALDERLAQLEPARLAVSLDDGSARFEWAHGEPARGGARPAEPAARFVVYACFERAGGLRAPWITSFRCAEGAGRQTVPLPAQTQQVVGCLVERLAGGPARILASTPVAGRPGGRAG